MMILKIPMCRTGGLPEAVQTTWVTIHTNDLGQPTRRSWAAIHQPDSTTVVTQADGPAVVRSRPGPVKGGVKGMPQPTASTSFTAVPGVSGQVPGCLLD